MQFVWFYVPGPDNGLELRLSIRSVMQHFQGHVHCTLIGDRPLWYTGHHIPVARVGKRKGERSDTLPFRDTQNKIVIAATHSEIQDEFCWIMDDVFFLQPVTEEQLKQPRFDPWYRMSTKNQWHRLIRATAEALRFNGFPSLQYATHLPHVFEKQKLLQMFDEFDFPNRMLLFEILYGNRFREGAIPHPPFLHRLQRPETRQQLDKAAADSHILNYVGSCWRTTMKGWLQQQLSQPSPHE